MAAGATAVGLGAAGFAAPGGSPVLGAVNVVAGAASAWIATRGIVRHHRVVAAREREASLARRAIVTPVVPVGGEGGAGVAVTLPF
jgi:hypothetical protein